MVGEYEQLKDIIRAFSDRPSFFATKFDPNNDQLYGLISPTINFDIIQKNLDNDTHSSLRAYADSIERVEGFGYSMLKEFKVKTKSDVWDISGFQSIKYETEYLFEHPELNSGIMVELSILNIDYGDFFLDFSMSDCKAQNNVETKVFS